MQVSSYTEASNAAEPAGPTQSNEDSDMYVPENSYFPNGYPANYYFPNGYPAANSYFPNGYPAISSHDDSQASHESSVKCNSLASFSTESIPSYERTVGTEEDANEEEEEEAEDDGVEEGAVFDSSSPTLPESPQSPQCVNCANRFGGSTLPIEGEPTRSSTPIFGGKCIYCYRTVPVQVAVAQHQEGYYNHPPIPLPSQIYPSSS